MIKYLFICDSFPDSYSEEYLKLNGRDLSISGAIYSRQVIKGLKNSGEEYFVISALSVGHYPFTSKIKKIKSVSFENNFKSVGYNNSILFSQSSKTKAIYNCFLENRNLFDDELNIIVSETHYPFMKAAKKIKRKFKKAKIVQICLDVPCNVKSSSKNWILKFCKKISNKLTMKAVDFADSFVFLSEKMKYDFSITKKPYFVSPCIVDLNQYDGIAKDDHNTCDIVYCGVLSKQFNVDVLLNSYINFIKKENFRLLLAGKGDLVELIKEKQNEFPDSIVYLGEISPANALKVQYNADILVNPRFPDSSYTSSSFPSKTINYILTKNPFVCYTFDTFPNDIKEYVISPSEMNEKSLSEAILNAQNATLNKDFEQLRKYGYEYFFESIDAMFKKVRKNG